MRLLVLYVRSRQVPMALAVTLGCVAVLWSLGLAIDYPDAKLGLLAVVAGAAATGPGLAGADVDLDRTAAIAWPPRRAAHIVLAAAIVAGIVAVTALTEDQLAPADQVVRNAVGMSGLVALGAATLGAGRAWIVPLTWTMLGLVVTFPPAWASVLGWMVQPAGSTPAAVTAVAIGVTGTLLYAIRGACGA